MSAWRRDSDQQGIGFSRFIQAGNKGNSLAGTEYLVTGFSCLGAVQHGDGNCCHSHTRRDPCQRERAVGTGNRWNGGLDPAERTPHCVPMSEESGAQERDYTPSGTDPRAANNVARTLRDTRGRGRPFGAVLDAATSIFRRFSLSDPQKVHIAKWRGSTTLHPIVVHQIALHSRILRGPWRREDPARVSLLVPVR